MCVSRQGSDDPTVYYTCNYHCLLCLCLMGMGGGVGWGGGHIAMWLMFCSFPSIAAEFRKEHHRKPSLETLIVSRRIQIIIAACHRIRGYFPLYNIPWHYPKFKDITLHFLGGKFNIILHNGPTSISTSPFPFFFQLKLCVYLLSLNACHMSVPSFTCHLCNMHRII